MNRSNNICFQTDQRVLKYFLDALAQSFEQVGIKEGAALDARLLMQHVLNLDHSGIILHSERVLTEGEYSAALPLINRRLQREPIARILGLREFWSLPFLIEDETLEPRPDTETLVEAALSAVPDQKQALRLLDLGTGTGCVLLSLLHELKFATGVGVDVSIGAVKTARTNGAQLGLDHRSNFIVSDWFSNVEGVFDLIVANPPYIPSNELTKLEPEVALYDPLRALDGGQNGLRAYEAIVAQISFYCSDHCWVLFECGANQAEELMERLKKSPFANNISNTLIRQDLAGISRVVGVEIRSFANETL